MQANNNRYFRNAATLTALTLVLSGCLMGDKESAANEKILTDHNISGSVGDGPVVGATVRILRDDGTQLAQLESDSNSRYDITVRTESGDYPLSIESLNGTDLVTNAAPDFALFSAVMRGNQAIANVHPFSTFTVELARDLSGGITAANLQSAEGTVVAELDFGLETLASSGAMTTRIGGDNIAEIVRASEALGETVRRTRDAISGSGSPTSGNEVVRALSSDLADSVVDGLGGARSDARIAAVATVVSAQVMIETMANQLRVNGADATQAMNNAINQVSTETVGRTLDDLTVTAGMLQRARVGLVAAHAVTSDTAIADLLADLEGVQAGAGSSTVRTFVLPADYRTRLDSAVLLVAGGSTAVLNNVNAVSRNRTQTIGTDNRAPTISGTPASSVEAGLAYSFTPTANDPDGDPLSFSIANVPTWASFNTATGALTGTPGLNDAGDYRNISITVTDGALSSSIGPFSINVFSDNAPPVISGTPASSVEVGLAYSFTPTANDPDGDPLSFSIANIPTWASFNTATGALTGTPGLNDAGDYTNISITVTDGVLSSSIGPFSINVFTDNAPPVISGTPPSIVAFGGAYDFSPSASDPNGDALTFSIANQPSWLSFDTNNGRLSGTPAITDVGLYDSISITVSDGALSSTLGPFSIEVTATNLPPTISGMPATEVNAGSDYTFTPTASDPNGDVLTFTATGLPVWASINASTGEVSGTPGVEHIGVYPGITITVSDGTEQASLAPFTITVQAVSLGSVTLNWTAPTQNVDGTALTDLDGYIIYWGTTLGDYPNSQRIENESLTTTTIDNLVPGTYIFVARSFNTAQVESSFSNTATITLP